MTDPNVLATADLTSDDLDAIRSLMDVSFEGEFSDHDWEHTLGGTHVLIRDGDTVLSHAAVVERRLLAGDIELRSGYVEGVATDPEARGRGHAAAVMGEVNQIISSNYDIGALSTDIPEFYAALGWERWQGPTYVDSPGGRIRTEDEDAGIMVLRTERTPRLDLSESLTCDWRSGDVW